MMNGHEKSDSVIVAAKPANKVEGPPAARPAGEPQAAEPVEPRAGTEGNADQNIFVTGQTRDIPGSDAILLRVMWSSTPAGRQCLA